MGKAKITAADLFCGAGGTSTGLREACLAAGITLNLIAVNHWDVAISTHSVNHPEAEHYCTNLDSVDPRKLIPSGKLDLLVASPECTHHSIARGGKPINDQSRASAWRIVEWASQIRIETILIENVKEFRTWGPLGTNNQPLKRRKGETYFAFLNALRALGYTVEDRILNAADYGDPTSRERLFVQAKLGRKPVQWPEPTHGPKPAAQRNGGHSLFEYAPTKRKPHRTAREIIDWSIPGENIFTRKRPLAPNTINRIFKGLEKFSGLPFIVPNFGEREGQQPRTHAIDRPLPAVTGHGAGALIQPYLVKFFGGHDSQSIDEPLPTVCANYEHYGLAQPFIVTLRNNQNAQSIDEPVPTLCASGTHHALCQPFIVGAGGPSYAGKPRSVDKPFNTVLANDHSALVQPFIIPVNHGKGERTHNLDKPMPTVTSVDAWALIQSYLVKYNGTGQAMPVDEPLDTVTAKDRFGLVEPSLNKVDGYFLLDIHFRMLQPHELAAAMSFPKSYVFTGNREQKVKQIGNAVPVRLARALCSTILKDVA
jgi:DNA (cytosine-5)-methyltransferase 1